MQDADGFGVVFEACISYLKSHWLGQHSIRQTLLVNFVLPAACLLAAQKLLFTPMVKSGMLAAPMVIIVLLSAYLALVLAVCVALNRRGRILAGGYSTNGDVVFANGAVLIAVTYLLISLADVLTGRTGEVTINAERGLRINPPNADPAYVVVDAAQGVYSVSGTIGIGASRRLKELLELQAATVQPLRTLLLDSDGGNIFEARGLANLVRTNNLATHVDQECLSACTLVFVSGHKRTANPQARFGFHAYRLDSKHPQVWLNTSEEQQKDEDIFFMSDVDPAFVQQIHETSPDALWTPSHDELQSARFLHSSSQ